MHKSQIRKIDSYGWFCAPGSHISLSNLRVSTFIVEACERSSADKEPDPLTDPKRFSRDSYLHTGEEHQYVSFLSSAVQIQDHVTGSHGQVASRGRLSVQYFGGVV